MIFHGLGDARQHPYSAKLRNRPLNTRLPL